MSEYLITTAKLKQAVKTDAYEVNHPSTNKRSGNWLIYAVGAFMVMLIAGVLILLVIHKKKLRKIHKSSPTSP